MVARPVLPRAAQLGGHAADASQYRELSGAHARLPVRARLLHTAPEILRNLPDDDNLAALVTIYWRRGRAPAIYRGATSWNYNQSKSTAGHTMLFAAFDPEHTNQGGLQTPGAS